MGIPWDIWLTFGFSAVLSILLLTWGLISLRTGYSSAWKGVGLSALAMLICIGGTLGMYSLYSSSGSTLESLKKPPGPSHLGPEWGAKMSKEDRQKYSQMLARTSFRDWGITVNYFDMNGALRPYQPTDEDRAWLEWRRQAVAYFERESEILKWSMLAWLFVPWIGLVLGCLPWFDRLTGSPTDRSKVDASRSTVRT